MSYEEIKKDIKDLLESRFGKELGNILEKYYDDEEPIEMIRLANDMLINLVGKNLAERSMKPIIAKYHKKLRSIK